MQLPKVISAATDKDPYAYYASLIDDGGIFRDTDSGLIVVSSSLLVRDVLLSHSFATRPAGEPIPAALLGTEAGSVFGKLVRMTDGLQQIQVKEHLISAISKLDNNEIAELSLRVTKELMSYANTKEGDAESKSASLSVTELAFTVPVMVMAESLGLSPVERLNVASLTGDFVRCISPLSSEADLARASDAAEKLKYIISECVAEPQNIFTRVLTDANKQQSTINATVLISNIVGLLSQTYDATAGLIVQTLVTMARYSVSASDVAFAESEHLNTIIAEVARIDSPIQNTRRFAIADTEIGNMKVAAGDPLLLLLAAANRDEIMNPKPNEFDLARVNPKLFTFSAGTHRCPGQHIAFSMCAGVVQGLLQGGYEIDSSIDLDNLDYVESVNARIPVL